MPKTTRAHGSGTRGSRRSRGSRSGLVIMRGPGRERSWLASLLVLQLLRHRRGQLVPRVDELLDALVLEHAEDVVEVHPGVGDGLHHAGGVVVGLLYRRPGGAV